MGAGKRAHTFPGIPCAEYGDIRSPIRGSCVRRNGSAVVHKGEGCGRGSAPVTALGWRSPYLDRAKRGKVNDGLWRCSLVALVVAKRRSVQPPKAPLDGCVHKACDRGKETSVNGVLRLSMSDLK